jgi:ketosteroid isomerase-like protein
MSQGDVEILRKALEQASQDPEAFYAVIDPAVEWDTTRQVPDGEVGRGVAGVRRFFRRWEGPLARYEFELEEAIDMGDQVFSVLRQRARGKGSGVPIEGRVAQIWTFRDGKVVRYRGFQDKTEALRAARSRD